MSTGNPLGENSSGIPEGTEQNITDLAAPSAAGTWLSSYDFGEPQLTSSRTPLPGPGLPESIAWLIGVVGMLFVTGVASGLLVLAGYAFTLPADQVSEFLETLQDPNALAALEEQLRPEMLVISQLMFMISAIFAVRLRLGRGIVHRLSFSPIPFRHGLLMLLLLYPVIIVSNQLYAWCEAPWQRLVERVPALEALDAMNAVTAIPELANEVAWPLLLFAMAIVPAVAEELVFRGVIGRGLTARWGIIAGVLLTSVLFAAAHIHPLHALGVIPLGIAMHFVYLVTRSFWAPMLFHFLNNALAVLMLKLQPMAAEEVVAVESVSALTVFMALVAAIAIGVLMWQMRVGYVLADGRMWDPGHESVESPPATLPALRSCRPATTLVACIAVICTLAFLSTIVQAAVSGE